LESCRISLGIRGARSTRHNEYCVIIDVLRATSTIITALAHGVEEILIVTSVRDALMLGKKDYTTLGERGGNKIPGFDLGNSPVEFLRAIKNHPIKKMVLTTSNLTRVLTNVEVAYICSSINLTAVIRLFKKQRVNIVAVGGTHGVVEDLGIALALMMGLRGIPLQKGLIQKMIVQSLAARHLTSIGYGDDVNFVTQFDKYKLVPLYRRGVVSLLKGEELGIRMQGSGIRGK